MNYCSDLAYVHLQEDASKYELLKGKTAFEQFAEKFRVKVTHYHADNGTFVNNAFIEDLKAQGQSIMYCGVNAHHQNGKAEKRIRDLQERTRIVLLHAMQQWPNAITPHLWAYALKWLMKLET